MRSRCCSRLAWPLPHTPLALQILHPHCSCLMEMTTATIHNTLRLSAHWLKRNCLQVMSPTISLKWTIQRLHRSSSTDRAWHRLVIQLRALRLPLLNRIWMMNNYGICWLHHCTSRRERGKCRPITNLSLLQRTLSVKFISLPSMCRETCRSVLTQKKVESRHIFRHRRHFLRTSTSWRKRRSSIQTLWIGKCCIYPQRQNRKYWNKNVEQTFFTVLFVNFKDIQSSRMGNDHTNLGFETSRKDQARLHEELAPRERVLRDTRIRSIHEVEELKRAQKNANWQILQARNERKSRYNTGAHFTDTGVAGSSEPHGRF